MENLHSHFCELAKIETIQDDLASQMMIQSIQVVLLESCNDKPLTRKTAKAASCCCCRFDSIEQQTDDKISLGLPPSRATKLNPARCCCCCCYETNFINWHSTSERAFNGITSATWAHYLSRPNAKKCSFSSEQMARYCCCWRCYHSFSASSARRQFKSRRKMKPECSFCGGLKEENLQICCDKIQWENSAERVQIETIGCGNQNTLIVEDSTDCDPIGKGVCRERLLLDAAPLHALPNNSGSCKLANCKSAHLNSPNCKHKALGTSPTQNRSLCKKLSEPKIVKIAKIYPSTILTLLLVLLANSLIAPPGANFALQAETRTISIKIGEWPR